MTKSERRRIAVKKREWDRILRGFNGRGRSFWKHFSRIAKREFGKAIRFTFCYQAKDNMELFLHIIFILSIGYVFWFGMR